MTVHHGDRPFFANESSVSPFFFSEYDSSVTYQTFSLDCNGAAGDMIYITDVDLDVEETIGHGISEVAVISGPGFSKSNLVYLLLLSLFGYY